MSDVELDQSSPVNNTEYVDYLRTIEDPMPEYRNFRHYLEKNEGGTVSRLDVTGHIKIHDVLSDNSILPALEVKGYNDIDTQTLCDVFSNTPATLRYRVILLGLKPYRKIDQRVLNLLRLSLDIEPAFFMSCLGVRIPSLRLPRYRECLRMGDMTLKLLRNCPTASGDVSVGKGLSNH